MSSSPSDWLEAQASRLLDRQRAQVETAKLLATFTAAVTATLVATSLQVGPPNTLDLWATLVLGLTALAAVVVILRDRLTETDHESVILRSRMLNWDDSRLLQELQVYAMVAVDVNSGVVAGVRRAVAVEIAMAVASAVLASVSLLSAG